MTIENWLLSIIPTLLLAGLAWIARRQFGSWFTPSAFFGMYWAVALLMPLTLAPDYDFWPGAAWFILFIVWCMHVGVQIGWAIGGANAQTLGLNVEPGGYELRWGRQILFISTLLGIIAVYVLVSSRGYPIWVLYRLDIVGQIARQYAAARYGFGESQPLIARILTGFVYSGGFYAGIWLFTGPHWRSRLLAFLPALTMLLQSVLLSARTNFLYMLAFMAASYFAMLVLKHEHVQLLNRKRVAQTLLIIGGFVLLIFAIQMTREDSTLEETVISLNKTRVSVLGSPVAFSQWLEKEWSNNRPPRLGAVTFGGVFELLGITERVQGVWADVTVLGPDEQTSNVYTIFRGLIEDFTLPGTIIVVLLFGGVAGLAYRRVLAGSASWLPVLIFFYAITMPSYLVSVFYYNSSVLAWAIFAFSLFGTYPGLLSRIPIGMPKKFGMVRIGRSSP